MRIFLKDPSAVLDYAVDWSKWLAGDTILTSTWTVPAGITKDSDSKTATVATVWLSGGTDGQQYIVTNEIVTADGRTNQRSITLKVKEQ